LAPPIVVGYRGDIAKKEGGPVYRLPAAYLNPMWARKPEMDVEVLKAAEQKRRSLKSSVVPMKWALIIASGVALTWGLGIDKVHPNSRDALSVGDFFREVPLAMAALFLVLFVILYALRLSGVRLGDKKAGAAICVACHTP
jgi:hypothetical protein